MTGNSGEVKGAATGAVATGGACGIFARDWFWILLALSLLIALIVLGVRYYKLKNQKS